jgi:hypothetical protein
MRRVLLYSLIVVKQAWMRSEKTDGKLDTSQGTVSSNLPTTGSLTSLSGCLVQKSGVIVSDVGSFKVESSRKSRPLQRSLSTDLSNHATQASQGGSQVSY